MAFSENVTEKKKKERADHWFNSFAVKKLIMHMPKKPDNCILFQENHKIVKEEQE